MWFIILYFLVESIKCLSYVSIEKYYQNTKCTYQSLGSVVITTIPSPCIIYGEANKSISITYDNSSQKINVTAFSQTGCKGSFSSSLYTLNNCTQSGEGFVEGWFLNFTIINELPFNLSVSKDLWIVEERYEDTSCVDTVTFYGDQDQIFARKSAYEDFSYLLLYVPYCSPTDKWEVIEFFDKDFEFQWYEYYPQKCKMFFHDNHNSGDIEFLYSFHLHCLNETEFRKNYTSVIPEKSLDVYEFDEQYFDSECGETPYRREVRKLDECGPFGTISAKHKDGTHFRAELVFEGSECVDSKLMILSASTYDKNNTQLIGQCKEYKKSDVHSNVQEYRKFISHEDVYLPTNLASFLSTIPCGGDLSSVKKNPGVQKIYYYDEDYCITAFSSKGYIRGRCEDGLIFAKIFDPSGNTNMCYGEYEKESVEEICYEYVSGIYNHLTCIPRYCGEYSEHDPRVCNEGKGICDKNDECTCSGGYYGQYCTEWGCHGARLGNFYHKDNKLFVCNGRGECASPDTCACNRGYSGESCHLNDAGLAVGISMAVTGPIFSIVVCCCCLGCCCCYLSILSLGPCVLLVSFLAGGTGLVALTQKKLIKKFEELDDFEILLQEQLAEKDVSMAHLKINKKLFEVPYEEIKIKETIGEGGSDAIVFKAIWHQQTIAFKCFKTKRLCSSQQSFDQFETEVNLLANLNHPNIIRFFGATLRPPRVGILMEYCSNGEILNFLEKYEEEKKKSSTLHVSSKAVNYSPHKYPIQEKIRFCREVISSLKFIHSRNIIHRDIKPENILIDESEHCKLMDFGISKLIQSDTGQTKCVGTATFMAPEIVVGDVYDFKADSFSFAVLVFCIFTELGNPYQTKGDYRIEMKVATDPTFRPDLGVLESSMGQDNHFLFLWIQRIVVKNWKHDPSERMDSSEILEYLEKQPKNEEEEEENSIKRNIQDGNVVIERQELEKKNDDDDDDDGVLRKRRIIQLEGEKELLEGKILEMERSHENEREKLKSEIEKLKSM